MHNLAIGSSLAVIVAIIVVVALIVIAPLFIWRHVSKLRKEVEDANMRAYKFQTQMLKAVSSIYSALVQSE